MIRVAMLLLILFATSRTDAADPAVAWPPVTCASTHPFHLQGVCSDEQQSIYWCFTTKLVKTDRAGQVVKQIDVGNHHGDLCFHDGKIHVAVNFGKFNEPPGKADSWVYIYAADDLALVKKHPLPQLVHGAGGIAHHEGKFLVVGGLPPGAKGNSAYEYDAEFKFVKEHALGGGYTLMGIQTVAFVDGQWWFGCYGDPKILLVADKSLTKVERFEFDGSLGIVPLGGGKFLIGRDKAAKMKGHTGSLVLAEADREHGLRLVDQSTSVVK
ncbi:MAG TPA: hypothetical protein VL096_01665 [Pirellulaceae bacterium]|nr:hypothetical protein [Pirellulaceae bacterium]